MMISIRKLSLLALGLFAISAQAALTAKDLVGKWEITTPLQPGIQNIVTLSEDGTMALSEISSTTTLLCRGTYAFDATEQTVTSNVACDNASTFTQIVNLRGVQEQSLKTGSRVTLRSSLFGLENEFPGQIRAAQ